MDSRIWIRSHKYLHSLAMYTLFLKYLLSAHSFYLSSVLALLDYLLCFKKKHIFRQLQWQALSGILAVNETHVLPLSLPGICASISEAGVRPGAERESGEEWKTLRGRASQPETGERNLPVSGGHSALSTAFSLALYTFSGTLANTECTGAYILHIYLYNYHKCLYSQSFKKSGYKGVFTK